MIIVQFAAARKCTDNEPSTRLQRNSCVSCLELLPLLAVLIQSLEICLALFYKACLGENITKTCKKWANDINLIPILIKTNLEEYFQK